MKITDKAILASADPTLNHNPALQIAHDRMLLTTSDPTTKEYAENWKAYLQAGGDRTMRDGGIDLDNWQRLKQNAH